MAEKRKTGCVAGGCGILCAGFALMVVIGMIVGGSRPDSGGAAAPTAPAGASRAAAARPAAEDYGSAAYYLGVELCKKSLKAPSTASFSSPYSDADTGWVSWGYQQWKVGGHVDAQNSFGAMLRESWQAVIKKSGDSFEVVYFRLGDDESGAMPAPAPAPIEQRQLTPAELAAAKIATEKRNKDSQARALKYHQDLAARNDSYGLLRMGERYRDGEGVEKDLGKARESFQKAAALGSDAAKSALQKLPPP